MLKKLSGVLLSSILFISALPVAAKTFPDVQSTDWFAPYVDSVSNKGLINGYDSGEFAPYANMTRGMFVQILYNRDGKPTPPVQANFPDVSDSDYYKKAVDWADYAGYMHGYGNGFFGGNDEITREDMITALNRYATKKASFEGIQAPGLLSDFPDYNKISDYALDAMNWAYSLGIIGGAKNLDPKEKTTRAHAAKMLDIADNAIIGHSTSNAFELEGYNCWLTLPAGSEKNTSISNPDLFYFEINNNPDFDISISIAKITREKFPKSFDNGAYYYPKSKVESMYEVWEPDRLFFTGDENHFCLADIQSPYAGRIEIFNTEIKDIHYSVNVSVRSKFRPIDTEKETALNVAIVHQICDSFSF